ncbi:MAG: molybdopterin-guanine dinucleotide biosynthesis protein B [Rhodospirillales bacterium]|jgi:molybdopterin-guanine dinucleotide biosynthesis adapter protein|nr:molybdopterin-guanine dinucleotide biosynthesis protein B [Rhodospirillales bacterium]MBT4625712.1 molybdopterin-guanine dinucleotide biosynthesis protein B [Rhodospirillales bacterium]MBT5352378.1 molybdopterin-guanine dinucleotide biosynthesis protein B [Rhodospirillales bacterium]MBT5519824.1 molybdopterin-guanine dinucleotide biosynthesis protein B [Rhodospirillales bacterium]MBT6111687.1 molybdopterin-guanine dinucleotide biosynthesis protein B [Rhodospirillales bacterium]
MKIFGLAGWSGSGKTTLVVQVMPKIIERGITVSTMKHTHHHFDLDRPGKDSHNHRMAGAAEVMLTSSTRWALLHELNDQPEPSIEELLEHMSPVDLVLIEGFKSYPHPKIEVHRPSLGKPLLALDDGSVVAVASDEPMNVDHVPLIDLNDPQVIADFIVDYVGLNSSAQPEKRPETRNGAA